MVEESQTVIIDNGSGFIKAGFAGEDVPRAVFRNIIGIPNPSKLMLQEPQDKLKKSTYIGDEFFQNSDGLYKSSPI